MLLTLPPELIQRVIRLSLDHTSLVIDLSSDNRANLNNISLVHSIIRPWAQAELYRGVVIDASRGEKERLEAALEGTGMRLSSHVRELFFELQERTDGPTRIVQATSAAIIINRFALRTLWLTEGAVDLAALVSLSCKPCCQAYMATIKLTSSFHSVLEELHLSSVVFAASTPLTLPRLSGLSLVNAAAASIAWSRLLNATTLPTLSTLSLAQGPDYWDGVDLNTARPFVADDFSLILPQLNCVSARMNGQDLDTALAWHDCTHLKRLTLRIGHKGDSEWSLNFIKDMPQRLDFLQIVQHCVRTCEGSAAYLANLGHLEAAICGARVPFEHLSLPIAEYPSDSESFPDCDACYSAPVEAGEAIDRLVRVAEGAELALERNWFPEEDDFELWSTYLHKCWYVGPLTLLVWAV